MCAITGFCRPNSKKFIDFAKWRKVLNSMNEALRHRGPNNNGTFLQFDCGLAHSRLSIVDLKGGSQPMKFEQSGSQFVIIYNGEVYNSKELKLDLQKKGVKFKTNSDTEIVLMGHVIYGPQFVEKINGIFAYAIWNEKTKTISLFRDRFGVKPLFFTVFNETLVFSSEIKALFKFPGVRPKIDRRGLCEIFGLGPARTPGCGVFKNVFEVKPGHFLQFSDRGLVQKPYWQLKSKEHVDSFNNTIEKTRFLVKDSILRQTVSDVSLCTFLSGGVDSSIVTAICAKEFEKQGKKLQTFSFDFAGNEKFFKSNSFQPSQDRPWVEKMVEFLQLDHTFLECSNENLIDNLFKVVDATDLPCMVDIEASLLHFCSKVAETNKVALTGECADEIFGGYPWFYKQEMFDAKTFPWSMNLEQRKVLLKTSLVNALQLDDYVQNAYDNAIKQVPKLEGENATEARRRELAYLNLTWFMQTLLNRMDRTSMFCGLEARVPFADHRLIEYVFNVPWEFKNYDGVVKGLLRHSAKPFLPHEVLFRAKSPYPKTYNPGFEQGLKNLISEKMSNCNSPIRNFVSKAKLKEFLKTSSKNYDRPWFGQLMAGPQMVAYMLQIDYWIEKFKIEVEF